MKALAARLLGLTLPLLGACTCGNKSAAPATDSASSAGGGARSEARTSPPSASAGAVFSAPIGGVRMGRVDVVAGLVAGEGVVRVAGIQSGGTTWSSDVLRGVAWTPDADLKLQPAGDGVALVWRGQHDGRSGRTLVLLGPHGENRSEPIDIGTAFCTTPDGIAWIAPHAGGPTHVRARRWSETAYRDMVAVPPDRDPGLVCRDRDVAVLGDGDDDLTVVTFAPGDASVSPPTAAIRDADFGDDEEREHDAYSAGDDLGLVRIGSSGAVSVRELRRGVAPAPWHRLKHTLSADDDVVAVDGDAKATFVVFTHEAEEACPGVESTAESVRALRIDRTSREEKQLDLAPPDCDRSRGPFWIAPAPGAPVIAWVERRTKVPALTAPIAGLALRVLGADGVRAQRIDLQADALADGGCDDVACSVAVLVRAPNTDGMQPEPIRVFGYP